MADFSKKARVFRGIFIPALLAAVVLGAAFARPACAIEDTYGTVLSGRDDTAIIKTIDAAKRKNWHAARRAAGRDLLATEIYQWLYYTQSTEDVSFEEIAAFIEGHPQWPRQAKLELAAERAIPKSLPVRDIVAWFDHHEPQTADGMDLYLRALSDLRGKSSVAVAMQEWWRAADLSADQQARFLSRYGAFIDKDAHVARFGALVMKKSYTNARALARFLGKGYPELAEARIALAEGTAGVDGVVARVPAHLQDDPGLLYERLRWRRRNGKDIAAIEILHRMPPAAQIPNPDDWWSERNILVRRLIENKQYESAYLLAKGHGMKEGTSFAEGEFLAGWLSLRFLHKPWPAFEHFEALYNGTSTPISRARGAYWAGRASEAMGYPDIARQWYQVAARYQTTFYGQIAINLLDNAYKPPQQVPPECTLESKRRFDGQDMVRVARYLSKAGLRDETTSFLNALSEHVETGEDYRLVAELAEELGHEHNAIRIAKKGLNRNILLMDQLFPTILGKMKNVDIEWALVHALIRQESAFDYKAVSPVGARGLMQLMPATAKEVARKNGFSQDINRLTTDQNYNIRIGSLYLKQMVDRFDGSYALALAAYNGGPGRVGKWIEQFGDPRSGEIDMIDWVEMIPVAETRNYVQRVLEGVYIYRMKLQNVQKSYTATIHVASAR